MFCRDRAVEGKGGGVLLYIKNVLRANQVEWRNQFIEQVGCKVKCQNRDLYIGVCYRYYSDTPDENCNKTCIVFPTTPIFCAPTVPCNTSNKYE